MPLSTLIEEAVAPHRDFGVAIKVRIAVAGDPRAGRHPQSGDPLWRRQHPGKRRRFRPRDRRGERVVERGNRRDRHFRRRPGHRARHAEADRRALFVAAARRRRGPKRASAASGSGFSSPARCWSAPAPRSRSPTGSFPITAPWCRSSGRASASRPTKSRRTQRLEASIGAWHYGWQRSTLGGLGSAILPRHMLDDIRHKDTRP